MQPTRLTHSMTNGPKKLTKSKLDSYQGDQAKTLIDSINLD